MRSHSDPVPFTNRELGQLIFQIAVALTLFGGTVGGVVGFIIGVLGVRASELQLFDECVQEQGAMANGGSIDRNNMECPPSMTDEMCTQIYTQCQELALDNVDQAGIMGKPSAICIGVGIGIFLLAGGLFARKKLQPANAERASLLQNPRDRQAPVAPLIARDAELGEMTRETSSANIPLTIFSNSVQREASSQASRVIVSTARSTQDKKEAPSHASRFCSVM